jgi:hypothetical protein
VIAIADRISIGQAVDELVTFIGCSEAGEWEEQVVFLPL